MNERQARAAIIIGTMIIIILMMLNSCSTVKKVVEYRDKIVTKYELQHDSIYKHDSVYIASRNDTVFCDRWRTEYAYKYVTRVDSFIQRDSVPYPVEVEKIITKNSGMARFALWWFWICIAAAVGAVGWWAFRKFYLHI